MRFLGNILAAIAAWSLALTPVAEAQFRPQAAITRSLPSVVSALLPQNVFATSLYTGNSGTQTITNGLDLLGKGGLTWIKSRTTANSHALFDTSRNNNKFLRTDGTDSELSGSPSTDGLPNFLSNGFTVVDTGSGPFNTSGRNYSAWSFRRAAKFFDIVTYTGDGTSGRVIPHGLGIKPGMIITKQRSAVSAWYVYHQSISATNTLYLSQTNAANATPAAWNNTEPTSTGFTVGSANNTSDVTYVAYLFAHDPDTTNGIVQCGSFTTDSGGNVSVNLGWRPQFLLAKRSTAASNWFLIDAARGAKSLYANASDTEATTNEAAAYIFTPTGFDYNWASSTQIYCAIRAPIQ